MPSSRSWTAAGSKCACWSGIPRRPRSTRLCRPAGLPAAVFLAVLRRGRARSTCPLASFFLGLPVFARPDGKRTTDIFDHGAGSALENRFQSDVELVLQFFRNPPGIFAGTRAL